jgi:hypothetical protein
MSELTMRERIVDKATELASQDGRTHGVAHIYAAADAFVAEIRREMDYLVTHFWPSGSAAAAETEPAVDHGGAAVVAVDPALVSTTVDAAPAPAEPPVSPEAAS